MMRLLFLFVLLFANAAAAHDSRPLAVSVTELEQAHFQIDWRAPPSVEPANAPTVALETPCTAFAAAAPSLSGRALYSCEAAQPTLRFSYPFFNPSLSTLVRVTRASGETSTALLGPETSTFALSATPGAGSVAQSYFVLGVEHILIGIDHILFLAGLLILAQTLPRILVTVTGFTFAHSVTLALVALDVVKVSIPAVEATIALSIVFVAAEIARGDRRRLSWRRPVIVATAFGLLHGAGFAAVLGEIGLPHTETIAALLFFNVGVEAGQLMLVAAALASVAAFRFLRSFVATPVTLPATRLAGYGLGLVSAYWFIERTAAAFT